MQIQKTFDTTEKKRWQEIINLADDIYVSQ